MPFLDWRRPFVSEINDQQNKWFSKEFWMLTAICCYHVWYILPVYSLMGTRCDGEPACALLCVISAISSLKICTQPSHIMVVVQQTLGCLMHHLAMCLKLWLWNSLPYCQVVSGMNYVAETFTDSDRFEGPCWSIRFGLNFRQYFSFQVSYNTLEAISKFLRQELVDVKLVRLYSTVWSK